MTITMPSISDLFSNLVTGDTNIINTTKIATTQFVNYTYPTMDMLDAMPKILAKPSMIESGGKAWYAPAGIRRGGPTPTYDADSYISTEPLLEKVGNLRWKLTTLSFDDLIGIQDIGSKYKFEKVNTDMGDEIHIVFESETDEAMSMFIIKPRKNDAPKRDNY